MIHSLGVKASNKTDVIGKPANRWKHFTEFHATLTKPLKFFDWCNDRPF
jgi:hypothetical protein